MPGAKFIQVEFHDGSACQGLDLSRLNTMTCLLARDSIYPVEFHEGLACQGLDLSRLNVMPGSLARDSIYPG